MTTNACTVIEHTVNAGKLTSHDYFEIYTRADATYSSVKMSMCSVQQCCWYSVSSVMVSQ